MTINDECINKMEYIDTMEWNSALKESKILIMYYNMNKSWKH